MIQQFYFWVYTQKNWKQELDLIPVQHVHSNIIHNSQKVEATPVSISGWLDGQNVVHT